MTDRISWSQLTPRVRAAILICLCLGAVAIFNVNTPEKQRIVEKQKLEEEYQNNRLHSDILKLTLAGDQAVFDRQANKREVSVWNTQAWI